MAAVKTKRTKCEDCPLRPLEKFRDFNKGELSFVTKFKTGELEVDPGATILLEGTHSAHLFTVLSGWAFRYKMLEDGRRQILNFAVPGDLIGLQGSLMGEMQHSVEALSPVKLCMFERGRLEGLFRSHPALAYDITWLAASEERILDENLLSVGQRSALERAAYLLVFLYQRATAAGASNGTGFALPISQLHVADTLGLSVVHTNKTLRKLAKRRLIKWSGRSCEVLDETGLLKVAGWKGLSDGQRPFI